MPDGAQNLAAAGGDDRSGIAFQRVTEGVVGGQEEPGITARLGERLAGAFGEHVGIVGYRKRVWRAGLAGDVGAGAA